MKPLIGTSSLLRHSLEFLTRGSVFVVLVIAFLVFLGLKPEAFATASNLLTILRHAAPILILAGGLTACLMTGEVDVSVGAAAGVAGVTVAALISQEAGPGGTGIGMSLPLAIFLTLLIGLVVGLVNGFVVAKLGVPAFLATIGMMLILQGVQLAITEGRPIFLGMPESFATLGRGEIGGVDYTIIIAVVITIALWICVERSVAGREMQAVGNNRRAAYLSGVDVAGRRILGFCISGIAAALAGILLSARGNASYIDVGLNVVIPTFAAAFLGTAVWRLGQFHIGGTVVGTLFMTVVTTGLIVMFLPAWSMDVTLGLILVGALVLSNFAARD